MGDGKQRRARWRQQGSEAAAAAAGCRSRATHCSCAQCIDWLDPRRVVQRHTGRSRVDAAARGGRLLPVSDASRRVCRAAAKETRTGREILNRQIDNREQHAVDMLYTINFNFRSAVRAFYVLTLNGIKYLRFIDRMIHVMSNTKSKTLSNSHGAPRTSASVQSPPDLKPHLDAIERFVRPLGSRVHHPHVSCETREGLLQLDAGGACWGTCTGAGRCRSPGSVGGCRGPGRCRSRSASQRRRRCKGRCACYAR